MKKGLRHGRGDGHKLKGDSKLALMKKGLRHLCIFHLPILVIFKTCPDEEGIKTECNPREFYRTRIQNLP